MPSRMPRPNAAAGPSKAADCPNTIRSSKTPGSAWAATSMSEIAPNPNNRSDCNPSGPACHAALLW